MISLIFFADTHLGFDFPLHPRVEKEHRGPDFFRNYERVLDYARERNADLVIHGGDLFFRSRVPQAIVDMAYERIFEFAGSGIPLFIVPGNHERSKLPPSLFIAHPKIHIFHDPSVFRLHLKGAELAVCGFPFEGGDIRAKFPGIASNLLEKVGNADIKLLCMHEIVEGAKIGPSNYTFRYGSQVIRRKDLPRGFHCILSGHIHRQQVLRQSHDGDPEPVTLIYPGSVERTSFAEKDEEKGFYELKFSQNNNRWLLSSYEFIRLPARPMIEISIDDEKTLPQTLEAKLKELEPGSVVRLKTSDEKALRQVDLATLRNKTQMLISLRAPVEKSPGITKRELKDKLKKLPTGHGVYMLLGPAGRVMYVGKSRNLKSRVGSYFYGTSANERFRRQLRVEDVKTYTTRTELLALLLEDRLIKKYLPELNERQKQFSEYGYLAVTGDPYPALAAVSDEENGASGRIYGPFKDRYMIERLRELLCRNLGMRHCLDRIPEGHCLNHDAGLCSGPCFQAISQEEYLIIVRKVISFLDGDCGEISKLLEEKMMEASEKLEFENAAKYHDALRFAKSFCSRQRFLRDFSNQGLVIYEKTPETMTYLFLKGDLVRAAGRILSGEEALALLREISAKGGHANPEDRRFLADRGNIVFSHLNRDGVEHRFLPI